MKISAVNFARLAPAGLVAIIFILIAYRANSTGITYGEAYTYLYYVVEPLAGPWDRLLIFSNGNNHLLNTFLIKLIHQVAPFNEWLIRLPNILAFLAFATAASLLTKTWGSNLFSLTIFSALILSSRHIEFFGLARGYGLGLAFGLWGIFFFSRAVKEGSEKALKFFGLGSFCIALAVWSNFSFLYLAGALPITFLVTRSDSFREFSSVVFSNWRSNKGSFALAVASFVLVVLAAMAASQIDFPSSQFDYFWNAIFPEQIWGVLQVFLLLGLGKAEAAKVLLLIWAALYLMAGDRKLFFSNLLLTLTLLSSFVPWLINQELMTGRTTLYFFPLIILSLGELSWSLLRQQSHESLGFAKVIPLTFIFVFSCINFFSQFPLDRTWHVRWDYGYRAAIEEYREYLSHAPKSESKLLLCMPDHPSVHFYVHKTSLFKYSFTVSASSDGECTARYLHPGDEMKVGEKDLVRALPWGRLVIYAKN